VYLILYVLFAYSRSYVTFLCGS